MDGRTLACGAVCAVERVKNPIGLRGGSWKTRSTSCWQVGRPIDWPAKLGCQPSSLPFDTRATRARWHERQQLLASATEIDSGLKRGPDDLSNDSGSSQGTVGCVAKDSEGNLAAATSSGGMTGKLPGRAGDSPIIGAGTWAETQPWRSPGRDLANNTCGTWSPTASPPESNTVGNL